MLAEGRICYAYAHRIRPLCAAAQHQQERARGRRKRPGSTAGMQAAGSEAERRQAGLTERKVRVASLTEAECRVMQSRSHTSLLINPILNHFIVIKCVRVAYHSWGHPLGRYGWNGDGRVGWRGPFRRLRAPLTFTCAPARLLRTVPVELVSRAHSIYPIPILTSLGINSWPTSYTSVRDGHRSPMDAAQESSEQSHLNPSTRRVLCGSCYTSG